MIKPSDEQINLALQDALKTLSDFHHQTSLISLRQQLEEKRAGLKLGLRLLSRFRLSVVALSFMLWGAVMLYPKRWFTSDSNSIYAVSLTRNNSQAFSRLNAVLASANLEFSLNTDKLALGQRLRVAKRCLRAVQVLRNSGDESDFVFLHQILATASLFCFVENLIGKQPLGIVAANDHSPPTVALFALARSLHLPSCYLQHGPVTESFPPLRYDLSILLNQYAADIYRTVSTKRGIALTGEIALLPAMAGPLVSMKPAHAPFKICIALSFFTDLDQLEALIDDLIARPDVLSVMISRHPRCEQNLSTISAKDRVTCLVKHTSARTISQSADLCLVGNSGVALEFLHYGCPTFYLEQKDGLLDDYYGFVAAGILPRFHRGQLDELSKHIASFDRSWRKRMVQFDPLTEMEPDEMNDQVLQKYQKAFGDPASLKSIIS